MSAEPGSCSLNEGSVAVEGLSREANSTEQALESLLALASAAR